MPAAPNDLLLETVERFLRTEIDPHAAELDLQPAKAPPVDLVAMLNDLGLLGLSAMDERATRPESLARLVFAIARHDASVAAVVLHALVGDFARRLVHDAAIPEGLAAFALHELGDIALEEGKPRCQTALRDGRVTGKKRAVALGPCARVFAIACAKDGEARLAWTTASRVAVGPPLGLLGLRALPVADVELDGCPAKAVSPLGAAELTALLATWGLLSASAACGTASAALAAARSYSADRRQGGRAIADYDAVKLLLAPNEAAVDSAQAGLESAATGQADDRDSAWARRVLAARLPATRAAVQATLDAVQVMGGYGYMRDYGQEKRFRDAVTLSLCPMDGQRLALFLAHHVA